MHFKSNPNPLAECLTITDEWERDGTNIGEPNQQRQQKCTLLLAKCNHRSNHPCTGIIQWFSYWLHHHPHPTSRVHLLSSSPALPFEDDLYWWLDETTSHSPREWLKQSQLSLLFRVYANNAVDHHGNRPALMSSSVWQLAIRELHKITSISWSGGGGHFSQNYRTIIRFSCTTPSLVYSVHRA